MGEKRARKTPRLFHPPPAAAKDKSSVILTGDNRRFRLSAGEADPVLRPATQWSAYGKGRLIAVIEINDEAGLPWSSTLTVEAL